ncbi:YokU family protein [Bacillus tianshenii]|nr:YokU family protein [Bacillus tianshenii]
MKCKWCDADEAIENKNVVYWELPDGSRAITITETPSRSCQACGMEYQEDDITKEIEDQLFLINTKDLEGEISYEALMEKPRLLKRNYFDFTL